MFYDLVTLNQNKNVYLEKYNDWYLSSANPDDKRWTIQGIFENQLSNDEIGTYDVVYQHFSASYTKLPLVLSVNYHKEGSFVKRPFPTPFDDDEYHEEEDDSAKIQLFIDEPKAKYYNILLSNLPENYKTNIEEWKDLIKSCKHCGKYKLLFKEFSDSTNFADLFEHEWNSNNNVERIPMGYYHQICMTNKKFVTELNAFIKDYIEYLLYQNDFTILDKDASEIIRFMTYGKFYYNSTRAGNKWWQFINHDNTDIGDNELYKWQECTDISTITMNIIYNDYAKYISDVRNKIESILDENKSKKILTELKNYSKKIGHANYPANINKILPSLTNIPWLHKRIDSYPDIIGVKNGIVNLRLTKGCSPEPVYITGYSKYFITKSTNANYRPFNKNDPACKIWLDFMRDTTPEKDARDVKWFLYSTGLDQACVVSMMLQITGDGGNGKSVEIDNVMYVLGTDYSTKLSSNLLMGKSKPGQADNDLMQMKNKNIGFICETDQNDVIVASRLKTLAEFIKTGRKNYGDPENFQTNCTVIVATNFALNIIDTDYGTFRRTAVYRQPFKYVAKPNPRYPEEKQMDRKYERLSMNNPEMADGLLACLIHKRIKFHKKYNSEIDKVPMPTIEKYTNEYRKQQNSVMSFLSVKLVMLKGYAKDGEMRDDITESEIADYYLLNNVTYTETITLDDIIVSYRNWYKTIGVLNKNDEILKNEFRQSAIGKLFKDKDNGRIVELNGYRILEPGKRKLPEERYFM
jgi:phage/plasmid-associated DNA primase